MTVGSREGALTTRVSLKSVRGAFALGLLPHVYHNVLIGLGLRVAQRLVIKSG